MRQHGQQARRTRSREADRMVATRFRLVRCCYRKLAYPCHSTPTMGWRGVEECRVAGTKGRRRHVELGRWRPSFSPTFAFPCSFFGGGIT
ncbi:hypothetical protein B296_00052337 [Ensete ventricosum]|uniref:Uncharacterized protein n=1 Tax=Ensete ventricosum TaxID=4639 RepID=A0A426YCX3_ENSVE|nr:hypothetical protein B296_00052337 [Ensete ventricosum]